MKNNFKASRLPVISGRSESDQAQSYSGKLEIKKCLLTIVNIHCPFLVLQFEVQFGKLKKINSKIIAWDRGRDFEIVSNCHLPSNWSIGIGLVAIKFIKNESILSRWCSLKSLVNPTDSEIGRLSRLMSDIDGCDDKSIYWIGLKSVRWQLSS